MIELLAKRFIKTGSSPDASYSRKAYGILCGAVGIFLNILLFAGKYFAGIISGSIAITADAFNNLSDAGSSVITLLGFRLSGMKPDAEHPYGHGRIEYIAGLVVSVLIIYMGIELIRSSVVKIVNPEPIDISLVAIVILVVSICVKLYMFSYNRRIGKKINSGGMQATAIDSLSDSVATCAVLISTLISLLAHINLDGYCGCLVGLFIIYAGFNSAKDTMSPILGKAPDPEFIKQVEGIVLSHPEILGVHDLMVHDYGPGRVIVSLHAEVSGNGNIFQLHDVIDLAERQLQNTLGCLAVIHMDPIVTDDPIVADTRSTVSELVKQIDPRITIHDFRMVTGPTHSNLIFDIVVPVDIELTANQIRQRVQSLISEKWSNYFTIIDIDQSYI